MVFVNFGLGSASAYRLDETTIEVSASYFLRESESGVRSGTVKLQVGETEETFQYDGADDPFVSGSINVTIESGETIKCTATFDDVIAGFSGEASFKATLFNEQQKFTGSAAHEFIFASEFADTLFGLGGSDTFYAGSGNDIVNGGAGTDLLIGAAGKDKLDGGKGSDYLGGGEGDDNLIGGKNSDTFYFDAAGGKDTIVDFGGKGDNRDTISVELELEISGFGDLKKNHMEERGDNVLITADDGSKLLLLDIDLKDLSKQDFYFSQI